MRFRSHMPAALAEARAAAARGEAPVGALIADPRSGEILARAGNAMRGRHDPTAHAEILAIRAACAALGRDRLDGLDLWATLEPCPMCAGAIAHARIGRVYYGAEDPKGGGVAHGPEVFRRSGLWRPEVYGGIAAGESLEILRGFFAGLREEKAAPLLKSAPSGARRA
ncbi:nucleoside deaminase [Neomegalonema perideroedes]|uniref:nucleoside deaminase n=1 Tax=Neomegalonema perideroedes TaxID=217219 RepID=UPI0003A1A58A|nr:nucleoside deaminase [Neomegalonema perideroedes]